MANALINTFPLPSQNAQWAYSAEIDLTTTGTYTIIPPMAAKIRVISAGWEVKTTGGTISVSPTFQGGAGNTPNDWAASQTQAGFTTQPAESSVLITTVAVTTLAFFDITANGMRVQVTAGATGSSPVLTARVFMSYGLLPV